MAIQESTSEIKEMTNDKLKSSATLSVLRKCKKTGALMLKLNPALLNQLTCALDEQGWFEWPHTVSDALCQALICEATAHAAAGALHKAGVGRGAIHQVNAAVRCDEIKWLTGQTAAQKGYLLQMAALQVALNRALFLGLFDYEGHFALYPAGGFYKKHTDSFRGAANRLVSTVLYLNPDWQADWGGALVIDSKDPQQAPVVITPEMGKLVIFMSEEMPHEVLPTLHPRVSVAGWFRCNNSSSAQVDLSR
jgi:SM-20-related protein